MKKILTTLFVLLFVSMGSAQIANEGESDTTTLIDARIDLRDRLSDTDSLDYRWSNSTLDNFLQGALRSIASYGVVIKRDTVVTAANTLIYALNSDFMDITGALIKGSGRWKALTYKALMTPDASVKPFGRDKDPGTVSHYYVSDKKFLIDPIGSGGDTIIVEYKAYGNALTAYASIVNVPYEFQELIIDKAVIYALQSNRETGVSGQIIERLQDEYNKKLMWLLRQSEPELRPNTE